MNKKLLLIVIIAFLLTLSSNLGFCQSISGINTSEPISLSQIKNLSLQDLWLLRNSIYAKHGKPFKTYELHAYFMGQGYEPDRQYSDKRLTKIEIDNVKLIRERELALSSVNYKSKGGDTQLNFSNIKNRFQYPEFTSNQKDNIEKNGFVVTPARHEQLFHVYEKNTYLGIPSFITTDSLLQLYSIFFDFTLRNLEESKLLEILDTLNNEMLKQSVALYENSNNVKIKKAAKGIAAYFSVPRILLGGNINDIHVDIRSVVEEEISKIQKHDNIHAPAILLPNGHVYSGDIKYWVDYSQFLPRGHYTRSDDLKRYFMAALWYGLYDFPTRDDSEIEVLQSLIITKLLYSGKAGDRPLIELWKDIYEPTVFYVGLSDDIGPDDIKPISDEVFGKKHRIDAYVNSNKLVKTRELIKERFKGKTKIKHVVNMEEQGPEFRLLGQRYIPDSEIMQRLVKVSLDCPDNTRAFPKGLDVMAVLGCKLAEDMMLTKYRDDWETGFKKYPEELDKLKKEFNALGESDWKKNLYTSWLWSLKALINSNTDNKVQFFMKNKAWEAKNLNTSLASWSQLRHHTILYAKQSFSAAECGGGEEEYWVWVPEPPKGYVEPNLVFFNRLIELLEMSRHGLESRSLLDSKVESFFNDFGEKARFLGSIAQKEINGTARMLDEYNRIHNFGSELDDLTFKLMSALGGIKDTSRGHGVFTQIEGTDRRIPMITDVHTTYCKGKIDVLEEATGYGNDIYVAIDENGSLKLTRGAVLSYYEFTWPASDRLTDEKWQKILSEEKEPKLPDWTNMFISTDGANTIKPLYNRNIGPKWSDKPGWEKIYYDPCG